MAGLLDVVGASSGTTTPTGRHTRLPRWFPELDAEAARVRCPPKAPAQVRDTGWTRHTRD
ncbi:hypothetical protein [Actinacidiphila sp. bgisy160]|uniref:hypothetical protein n=1 Tax=Actinacidiphila sp. bgisy160 TaxID=3413796 RepID=UPI003D70CB88